MSARKKQKTHKQSLSVTIGPEHAEALEELAKCCGENISLVLRNLIPEPAEVEAANEFVALVGDSKERVLHFFSVAYVIMLERVMLEDTEKPIGLQLMLTRESYVDDRAKIIELFLTWARAKRGVKGYRFRRVIIAYDLVNKPMEYWVALSPSDSKEKLYHLREQMIRHVKELGAKTTRAIIKAKVRKIKEQRK